MNYFQAYLPSLDEAIVAAWESQVAATADTPWLAQALAAKSTELFPRFAGCYAQLRALPRGARRVLQRRLARSCELRIPPDWQHKLARSLAGTALLLALGEGAASASTIKVNTKIPGIISDGKCSLIEAIENANDTTTGQPHTDCAAGDPGGADTIKLPKKTITLASVHNSTLGATGLPVITSKITIEGNRAKIVRDPAAAAFRLMAVDSTGDLTLKKLTLSGGERNAGGGGILNIATLTIENSTVSGNSASFGGGGILNNDYATLTIRKSTISGNSADFGGGIYNDNFVTLTIENSRISGNSAASLGGGIHSTGGSTVAIDKSTISGNSSVRGGGILNSSDTLTIDKSTISGNSAVHGGGIYNNGDTVTIENSTVSGNSASYGAGGILNSHYATMTIGNSTVSGNSAAYRGGGIYNDYYATLTIENSTVSGNSTNYGGGILNNFFATLTIGNSTISGNSAAYRGGGIDNDYQATLMIGNSLISGNTAPTSGPEVDNSGASVTANDFNVFGVSGVAGVAGFSPGASDIVPTVPLNKIIRPLKKNGGPTKTHALVKGSPALNAVPLADPGCAGTDQRGVSRPQGAGCDIGAFEKQ